MSPPSPAADTAPADVPVGSSSVAGRSSWLSSPMRRAFLLGGFVVVVLAFDQWTKVYAMTHWQPTSLKPLSYLNGMFRIQYAENPGAFLSLFGGLDQAFRFWLFQIVNGAMLLGVTGLLLSGRWPPDLWQWSALALILAGGIGNLIDRVRFENHVIDFLIVSSGAAQVPFFGEIRTGIFNIADIAITAGFLMLLPGILQTNDAAHAADAKESA
ncbi:MAG: signal peptidase II [Planctomycetaceae bacterium]